MNGRGWGRKGSLQIKTQDVSLLLRREIQLQAHPHAWERSPHHCLHGQVLRFKKQCQLKTCTDIQRYARVDVAAALTDVGAATPELHLGVRTLELDADLTSMAGCATAFLQGMSLGNANDIGDCALPERLISPKTGGNLAALKSKLSCTSISPGADPLHPELSFRGARLHSDHVSHAEGDRDVRQYGFVPRDTQKISPDMKRLTACIQPVESNLDIGRRCWSFWQSSRSHTRDFP